MKKIILLFFVFFITLQESYSQCNCTNTSFFVPSIHWLGSADRSLTPRKNLRLGIFYRYAFSSVEYENDKPRSGDVSYRNQIATFFISYGIDYFTSLESDIGYSFRELQQYGILKSKSYGFSHFSVGVRRNIYENESSTKIFNIGGGVKIPLSKFKDPNTTSVVLQPSNGTFGTYLLVFGQFSYSKNFNFAFQSRFDYNLRSRYSYHFGSSLLNSLVASSEIIENLFLILETRCLVQLKDKANGEFVENSGSIIASAVLQLVYRISDFSLSISGEFPFYKKYNGLQIAEMPSLCLFFNWVINFNKGKL